MTCKTMEVVGNKPLKETEEATSETLGNGGILSAARADWKAIGATEP